MNLEKFKVYQTEFYAKRMKELQGLDDKVAMVNGYLASLVANCGFTTFASVSALSGIVKSGSYLTMQELGFEKRVGGSKERTAAITALFNEEPQAVSDYPKYAMLTDKDIFGHLLKDSDPLYHYGPVLIFWKKDNVLKRTTMTIGSSFNFGECFFKCPTFVDACTITGLHGNSYRGYSTHLSTRDSLTQFAQRIENGTLTGAASLADAYDGEVGFEDYELQIHGNLSLDEDVEGVGYFSMGSDEDDRLFASLKEQLTQKGIKAFEIES